MAFIYKEPIGPVLVIPPWNAALVLCTRALASAVGAGCTAVLKASELSPYTHSLVHDIFIDAGAPPGVINLLISARSNAAETTEALISNPAIRKIDFIGSAAVGRIIGATAARHLKPVLMELGGKCPAIVLDDANLERAAMMCARGALMHHGQICFSTERIIVQRSIAQKFTDALVTAVKNLAAQGVAGTAVSESIAQHAYDVLQDAKSRGSRFIIGDAEWEDGGKKKTLKPAIVSVDPKAEPSSLRIIDEETFGPSASLYIVDTDEEAIEIANRSAYGLNASVHTQDLERGLKVGRELEYGQVHLNFLTAYTSRKSSFGSKDLLYSTLMRNSDRASGWCEG
jgi:acyl-CoA reductase-like NAD-dependent aldehyde dehydrogenase